MTGTARVALAALGEHQPQQQARTGNQHHQKEEIHHRQGEAQLFSNTSTLKKNANIEAKLPKRATARMRRLM